jgi:hypothetical protein
VADGDQPHAHRLVHRDHVVVRDVARARPASHTSGSLSGSTRSMRMAFITHGPPRTAATSRGIDGAVAWNGADERLQGESGQFGPR